MSRYQRHLSHGGAATPRAPIRVAVVVFPECDPSMVFGIFDVLWSAGRLWSPLIGAGSHYPYLPTPEGRLPGSYTK